MASKNGDLSENLEDYLEVILDLEAANKVARVKDIADKMGVLRGSVTGALKSLAEKNLINYEPYSFITLTPEGNVIAREIARRHAVIKDFLHRVLKVGSKKADETACRMEHAMDKTSFDMFVKFIEFIDHCPRTGPDWVKSYLQYCAAKKLDWHQCSRCLEKCSAQHARRQKPE